MAMAERSLHLSNCRRGQRAAHRPDPFFFFNSLSVGDFGVGEGHFNACLFDIRSSFPDYLGQAS